MEPFVVKENSLASASSPLKKRRIDHTQAKADGSAVLDSNSNIDGAGGDETRMNMDAFGDNSNNHEIDEDLHSRQLAVYGRETMRRLFASNVLISGMQGLGVEIGNAIVSDLLISMLISFCMSLLCLSCWLFKELQA